MDKSSALTWIQRAYCLFKEKRPFSKSGFSALKRQEKQRKLKAFYQKDRSL